MVLTLVWLAAEFDSVRNQILFNIVVLSYDTVSEQLLRLSIPHTFGSLLNFQQINSPCTPTLPTEVDEVEIVVAIVLNVLIATIINGMVIFRQTIGQSLLQHFS